jgi:hypothetical protein
VATVFVLAALSIAGGVLTQVLVPETGSRSLEEINRELAPVATTD